MDEEKVTEHHNLQSFGKS